MRNKEKRQAERKEILRKAHIVELLAVEYRQKIENKSKVLFSIGYTPFGVETDEDIRNWRILAETFEQLASLCKELIAYGKC